MCKLARRNRRWRRATQPTSSQPCEGRPSVLPSCLPSPLSLFEHIQAQRAAVIFNGFPTNFTRQQNLLKKKKKKRKDFRQNGTKSRENCEADKVSLGCRPILHFRILPSRLPTPCQPTPAHVLFSNSWRPPLGWGRGSYLDLSSRNSTWLSE